MIVVIGRVSTDPSHREELIRVGQAVAQASRAEPGCLRYQLLADSETAEDFVFVEEWEGEDALQRHFSTPHIATFMQAIGGLLVGPPDVQFHTIGGSRDLTNVATAPAAR